MILIAGDGYALLPWDLGCTYAVLGWCGHQHACETLTDDRYWVSAAWYEPEACAPDVKAPPERNYFRRLKVRFDWVQSQGTPWWLERSGTSWNSPSDRQQPSTRLSQDGPVLLDSETPGETQVDQFAKSEASDTHSAVLKGPGGRDIINLPTPPLTPEVTSSERELQEALWHGTFTSEDGEREPVHAEKYQGLCLLRDTEPGCGSLINCFARKPGSEMTP